MLAFHCQLGAVIICYVQVSTLAVVHGLQDLSDLLLEESIYFPNSLSHQLQ